MRYLSQRLRKLDQKIRSNYIYATVTGTIVGTNTPQVGFEYSERETVFKLQPLESKFQVGIVLEESDMSRFKVGTPIHVVLTNDNGVKVLLSAVSVGVFRQQNGGIEALLDLRDQDEKNTKAILNAGYKGEGEQRIEANVTVGREKVWHTIHKTMGNISPFHIEL